MTARESKTATKETVKAQPTLMMAIGRQRVGKTTFLKVLTELTQQQGGHPEIWNTDSLNKSNTIASLGDYVLEPATVTAKGQAAWLEQRIEQLVETQNDAILDIGGGWTAVHELVKASPLVAQLEELGINLVTVFMIGSEHADIDYLEDLQANRGFIPKNTVVVINEALLSGRVDASDEIRHILQYPAIEGALGRGAVYGVFPALDGIKRVSDRGQSFMDFAANKPANGFPTSSFFDRCRVSRWLRRDVPKFLAALGPDYLPRMPAGLPEVIGVGV
ncbi:MULTISPECIES: FAD-binding oxidoreductase [Komagataeibacter]|uniref:FAD-binding oxidoreductase n=1 Tax=Komagataeibacter TaxID=1434011 RepID=UPI000C818F85|nr:FAD-binding oxidoreductase [Komagataeibacter saccharivorans]